MNRFELTAVAAEENHKAANAALAIAEKVPLPDIETVELEALRLMVEFELQDRNVRKRTTHIMSQFDRLITDLVF